MPTVETGGDEYIYIEGLCLRIPQLSTHVSGKLAPFQVDLRRLTKQ